MCRRRYLTCFTSTGQLGSITSAAMPVVAGAPRRWHVSTNNLMYDCMK